MRTQSQIISSTVKSLFMQAAMKRKGWSEQDAAYVVVEYLTCGKKISLFDFVEQHA